MIPVTTLTASLLCLCVGIRGATDVCSRGTDAQSFISMGIAHRMGHAQIVVHGRDASVCPQLGGCVDRRQIQFQVKSTQYVQNIQSNTDL